jgi:hypothetical protein
LLQQDLIGIKLRACAAWTAAPGAVALIQNPRGDVMDERLRAAVDRAFQLLEQTRDIGNRSPDYQVCAETLWPT